MTMQPQAWQVHSTQYSTMQAECQPILLSLHMLACLMVTGSADAKCWTRLCTADRVGSTQLLLPGQQERQCCSSPVLQDAVPSSEQLMLLTPQVPLPAAATWLTASLSHRCHGTLAERVQQHGSQLSRLAVMACAPQRRRASTLLMIGPPLAAPTPLLTADLPTCIHMPSSSIEDSNAPVRQHLHAILRAAGVDGVNDTAPCLVPRLIYQRHFLVAPSHPQASAAGTAAICGLCFCSVSPLG